MRSFIRVDDDIWDIVSKGETGTRIVESTKVPLPRKEWRELTEEEKIFVRSSGWSHVILFMDKPAEDKRQALANILVRVLPEVAEKHGLKEDISVEYWRS
jgi:hypothetical protein